ncbi:macro domain-containing protein [Bacillus testis]|uniref:macro domain-containing protein n=1 Tax=Bacillus testis TaxID=1622072 RepID=UPI00067E78B7|nr:macro domain-containing protein [Bacillus testis]
MITYHNGDLLKSGCDIICHQVNLQGVMGGGIALQIARKYPMCEVGYKRFIQEYRERNGHMDTGQVYIYTSDTDHTVIANCFSQDAAFNTDYRALENCFETVKKYGEMSHLKTIGVPHGYGCGIANGDWGRVQAIFEKIVGEEERIELQIWKWPGF